MGRIDGLDYSDAMLAKAAKKFTGSPNVTLSLGSWADMPHADNSFDGVMCNQVIQHVETDDTVEYRTMLKKCIMETLRVLKPGGVFVCSTRAKEPRYEDLYWYCEFFPTAVLKQSTRVPTKDMMHDIMVDAGFEFLDAYKPSYRSVMSIEHYLNAEGPFDEGWRRGESFWSTVSDEELVSGLAKIRAKINDGTITEFIRNKEATRKMHGQVLFLSGRKPML